MVGIQHSVQTLCLSGLVSLPEFYGLHEHAFASLRVLDDEDSFVEVQLLDDGIVLGAERALLGPHGGVSHGRWELGNYYNGLKVDYNVRTDPVAQN